MAIEAKRVADLEASWQAQLIVTNSALQAATNARIDAETVFGQQGGFSVKSIALGASRKANKEVKEAIRSLEGFWQSQQHDVAISEFTVMITCLPCSSCQSLKPSLVLATFRETLLVVLVSKIATQVVVVKAKLSIEKVTNSSG
jgi:hypothetical protein